LILHIGASNSLNLNDLIFGKKYTLMVFYLRRLRFSASRGLFSSQDTEERRLTPIRPLDICAVCFLPRPAFFFPSGR
jgi:hypothetical protein